MDHKPGTDFEGAPPTSLEEFSEYFERGQLYYRTLDFDRAISILRKVASQSKAQKNWNYYFESITVILRILIERAEVQEVQATFEDLNNLRATQNVELPARLQYVLGICHYYDLDYDQALGFFNEAITKAKQLNNQRDLAFGLIGAILVFLRTNQLNLAEEHWDYLVAVVENSKILDLITYTHLLKVEIFLLSRNFEAARTELSLVSPGQIGQYNGYISCFALYYYGRLYYEWNQHPKALVYLEMADTFVDKKNLKHLTSSIDELINKIRSQQGQYDLLIYQGNKTEAFERDLGKISFEGQHILVDLLNLFLEKKGKSIDKEEIVRQVWKESYDPRIHDNKIYVTIRRLRRLIEPSPDDPKYILRSKEGYMFSNNRNIRIYESEPGEV